jgi:hypothetical protein
MAGCGSGGVSWATEAMRQSRGTRNHRLGVQFAAQQREQARLAAAVRAHDAHPPAVMQLQEASSISRREPRARASWRNWIKAATNGAGRAF